MTADQILNYWPAIVVLGSFIAAWAVTRNNTKLHQAEITALKTTVAGLVTQQAVMNSQMNGLQEKINIELNLLNRQVSKLFDKLDKRDG